MQNQLVRLNWGALFVLGLSQFAESIHLQTKLNAISKHLSNTIKKGFSEKIIDNSFIIKYLFIKSNYNICLILIIDIYDSFKRSYS